MMLVEDRIFKISVLMFFITVVATIFYCIELCLIMKRIPREKHQFPTWFVWMFFFPFVGVVFKWIMIPFAIPNALKKQFPNNQDAIHSANRLFKIGLVQIAAITISLCLPIRPYNHIFMFIGFVLWMVYWVLIVKFKNKYMKEPELKEAEFKEKAALSDARP